jgi:hypothetical protein
MTGDRVLIDFVVVVSSGYDFARFSINYDGSQFIPFARRAEGYLRRSTQKLVL